MLPTINGKPIIECGKKDFEVIIDNPDYRENEYIDYKRNFSFLECAKNDPKRAEHISEFKSDVCAFANADGGYLIYGVSDKMGLASELVGIEIPDNNTDKFELERKNNLQSILPKIPSIKFKFVLLDNGKFLVIILIQRDAFAPYIHLHNEKDYKIYKRIGNGKTAMSYSEMKMQFNQSLSLEREIYNYRKERIDYYCEFEDDKNKSYSRFAIVHIIPDSFLDRNQNVDIYLLNRRSNRKFSGILQPFYCANNVRSNVDGVRTWGYNDKCEGQIGNNGLLELFLPLSPDFVFKTRVGGEDKECFAYSSFEENLEDMVYAYLDAFSPILGTSRIMVCISIVGCRGVVTQTSFGYRESPQIDRSLLIADPIVFDDISKPDNNYASMRQLKIGFHLAIGIGLSSDEIEYLENSCV